MPVWPNDAICACAVPGSALAGSAMQQRQAETAGENDVLCIPGLRLSQYCLINTCCPSPSHLALAASSLTSIECMHPCPHHKRCGCAGPDLTSTCPALHQQQHPAQAAGKLFLLLLPRLRHCLTGTSINKLFPQALNPAVLDRYLNTCCSHTLASSHALLGVAAPSMASALLVLSCYSVMHWHQPHVRACISCCRCTSRQYGWTWQSTD